MQDTLIIVTSCATDLLSLGHVFEIIVGQTDTFVND